MLFRFASDADLDVWMSSRQRRWWLDSAQGIADETRLERRTGIEGWFDDPSRVDLEDPRSAPVAPPRWKQMVSIFIVFFPLSVVTNEIGVHYLADVWLPLRVLITVCVMTPLMTYVLLPWVTRLLGPWLHRQPRSR